MSLRDAAAALLIAVVWGFGFVAMKYGVADVPPLMFSAMRFAMAAVPGVFLIKPPRAPARIVIAYGVAVGVVQFSLLFIGIKLGMSASLSSLLMQSQAFFTILFAWLMMGERPSLAQILGGCVAAAGVIVIGGERTGGAELVPFLLVVAAAVSWSVGNIIGKRAGRVDMLAFTIWSSVVAPLPLFVLSLTFEGRGALDALIHPGWRALASAAFLGYGATLLGYGLWANLLSRHPAALVAPFSLLVPVFGFIGGWLAFNEPTSAVEYMGAGLVFAGLSWTVFGGRFARWTKRFA